MGLAVRLVVGLELATLSTAIPPTRSWPAAMPGSVSTGGELGGAPRGSQAIAGERARATGLPAAFAERRQGLLLRRDANRRPEDRYQLSMGKWEKLYWHCRGQPEQ